MTIKLNLFSNFLGNLKNSDETVYKGKFEVPNLSEEHSPNDVDVREFYFRRNCFVYSSYHCKTATVVSSDIYLN